MSADDGPAQREVAHRVFAAEYEDATVTHREGEEERAPTYVVTPSGARANRLFFVGVLTEVEDVNEEMVRARVVDPTGAFVVYAGQYQPDERAFFERAEPPEFVAVTGKARTFEPEGADRVFSSVRPESVNAVDAGTRDRWVVDAARDTLGRVAAMARAIRDGADEDPGAAGLDPTGGVALALDGYGTTPAYLSALRDLSLDALRVVADDREEVRPLRADPGDGGPADVDALAGLSVDAAVARSAGTGEAGTAAGTAGEAGATAEGTGATAEGTGATAGSAGETGATARTGAETEPATGSEPDADAESETDVEPETEPEPEADTGPETEPEPAGSATPGESDADAGSEAGSGGETEAETATETEAGGETAVETATETEAKTGTETEVETGTESGVESGADSDPTGDDDIGDFEPGDLTAGDDGEAEVDAAVETDEMYELDEEERREVEEEYGTEFTTGTEVESPDEGSGPAGDAPADAGSSEAGEPAAAEPDADADPGEETGPDADAEPADDGEPEGTEDAEPEAGEDAEDGAAGDADLDEVLMDHMRDLDDGGGADREALVESVTAATGASADEVDDAIQDALMGGQCYEPDDETLKPI